MSALMQRTLARKSERRKRLMALPYPEKVRIVEQMRAAVGPMHSTNVTRGGMPVKAVSGTEGLVLCEKPTTYGTKQG